MKQAMFYTKQEKNYVKCELCYHHCIIKPGDYGICLARKNNKGELISEVYGNLAAINIDPIEKKPLYNFFPGTKALSIGTCGCNFKCKFCQNCEISQIKTPNYKDLIHMTPKEIVNAAIEYNCESIAYTYNEPTINFEFNYETVKIAKRKKIKNIFVTNAYIEKKPLKKISKYLDAANIDLKSSNQDFYKKICKADLNKVLESIKLYHKLGIHIELTTMIVPKENDSKKDITQICKWVIDNLGLNVPMHFSRFYPYYKMKNKSITTLSSIKKAVKIAKELGIRYVYGGNVIDNKLNNTFCPKCNAEIIDRSGSKVLIKNLKNGICEKCGESQHLFY